MRHLPTLFLLLFIVILAWPAGPSHRGNSEVRNGCPTLAQLTLEKEAKEKKDREDKANARREIIRDKFRNVFDLY